MRAVPPGLLAIVATAAGCHACSEPGQDEPPFPQVKAHEITEIAITHRDEKIRLLRTGDTWRLVSPVEDTADTRRVEEALSALSRLALASHPVAEAPASWPRYEVADDEVLTARVVQGDRELPALHLGQSGFARIGEDPRIYEVPELRRDVLEHELSQWRDLSVLDLGDEEITAIEVIDADGRRARADRAPGAESESARALPDAAWVLTHGAEFAEPFDGAVPAALLRYLLTLRGANIAEGSAAAEALAEPKLRIRLYSDQRVHELIVGGRIDTKTALGTADSDRVFLLSHPQILQLARGPRQWRHKHVMTADPGDIIAFEVSHGDRRLRAIKRNRWELQHPEEAAIDDRAAEAFARRLAPLTADAVAEPDSELPEAAAKLQLKLRDGETIEVAIGERDDGTFLVASSARRDLLVIQRQRAEKLLADAFSLIRWAR